MTTTPIPCAYCGDAATDTIPDPNRQPGDPDRGSVAVCEFCFPAELLSDGFSLTKSGGAL